MLAFLSVDHLSEMIVKEQGKTMGDARGDVLRGVQGNASVVS